MRFYKKNISNTSTIQYTYCVDLKCREILNQEVIYYIIEEKNNFLYNFVFNFAYLGIFSREKLYCNPFRLN